MAVLRYLDQNNEYKILNLTGITDNLQFIRDYSIDAENKTINLMNTNGDVLVAINLSELISDTRIPSPTAEDVGKSLQSDGEGNYILNDIIIISDTQPTDGAELWIDTNEEESSISNNISVGYNHAMNKGAAFASGLYKVSTNEEGHVIAAEGVTKADIVALGIPGEGAVYEEVTQTSSGLMSSQDKIRLDEIPEPTSADVGKALQVNGNGDYYLDTVAPEYENATPEKSGLMSAADKISLDTIASEHKKITISNQDIVAGETELLPGELYFVYE